jgi:hypothetical protein
VWFYHVQTAFFAPYPSDADKLVLSTFAHDFKGNRFDFCHTDARVPEPPASSCAGFDAAVGHTLRLCSQVLRYPISRVFDPVIIFSLVPKTAPRQSVALIASRYHLTLSPLGHSTSSFYRIRARYGFVTLRTLTRPAVALSRGAVAPHRTPGKMQSLNCWACDALLKANNADCRSQCPGTENSFSDGDRPII